METRLQRNQDSRRHLESAPRLVLLGILLASLSVASRASAATYYLNTATGNDADPGTVDRPWKTLTQVQAGASAGDTIVIQLADANTYATPWPTGFAYRATVLQQFSITWTFDTDYPVGQFATGDFWVVGPVKIVGIDPPSTADSTGRVSNGSMLNPRAGYYPEGYDSAMPSNTYDPTLNVAFGVSASKPLTLAAGSSLISTISVATPASIPQLSRATVLTVLSAPAPAGSFRPCYSDPDKTVKYNKSALDYSLLQKLAPVSGTPALSDVEGQFAAPWIEHAGGWTATALRPKLNMPWYGREMHTAIGTAALMLHLNFTDAQKEKLLVEFVQLGIDFYGIATNGGAGNWVGEGGHGGGRKWPILFAGLVLHNDAMKAVGAKSGDYLYQNGYGPGHVPPDYIAFGEDDQTFYVARLDVDVTNGPTWNPDSRDAIKLPYETNDIGLAEWGITHSRFPYTSNKAWNTEYRVVAGPPFHGTALAALLMDGAKALWNHNAYFDYTDRYMAVTAATGAYPGWRSMSTFTANMWDAYRAQCGPIWPATTNNGPTLAPIGAQQVLAGQTLTLTIKGTGPDPTALTYAASNLPAGAVFSGQTFTWTPTTAQVGSYQVTFTISDGKYQSSQTITITVTQANSAPVLGAIGDKSTNENQTLTFTVSATEAGGGALTYAARNLPAGAGFAGQTFTWTPTYSQAGSYTVTFTASDGTLSDSQTITITVANVDRPPVLTAVGDQSVTAGSPLSFTLSATDPDGDSLTYFAGTLPSGATLTGSTFAWTPTTDQVGTYTIALAASDGTLSTSQTMTVTVTGSTASQDQTAPAVAQCSPAPDAIQVPLNNVMTLHVTDAGSGVNAGSVVIRVNGNVVYQGDTSAYASTYGQCSRTGPPSDYRFLYQPKTPFDFDQLVAVSVDAADAAGNVMSTYQYAFTTQMLAFGKNTPVSAVNASADGRPVTACDPAGTMWVAWHSGPVDSRDIYVARRPAGASSFQAPIRLTSDPRDQCNPALAIDAAGIVYVAWQDNRSGNWDVYLSTCSNGSTFSPAVRVTSSTHNETYPAVAVDRQSPANVYVAWQDDRSGNQDIYVAGSATLFATATVWPITNDPADQIQPRIAVDGNNVAYVFWTDMRSGAADIYGAAANAGPWTNVPIVTGPGAQSLPAVAAAADGTLHLVWVDNRSGNDDIYYACLNGLPAGPVSGVDIVDDTSGANQTAPAIVWGTTSDGVPRVFACWQDLRHPDSDVYAVELRSGKAHANIFVGDGGTNSNQSDPALGLDRYGEPYLVWADWRQIVPKIYSAATTLIDPTPVDAKTVVAAAGASLGTDPAAIQGTQDVSVVVPPGACPADLNMSISKILNPPVSGDVLLGSYEFGPSGVDFTEPVTVTIPYATTASSSGHALPYWYDSVTGALSQQGITDVQNVVLSSRLSALRFRTTHFTPFYLIEADTPSPTATGTGGGGGCALASDGDGAPSQLLVPYAAITLIMVILRRRDRRRAAQAAC